MAQRLYKFHELFEQKRNIENYGNDYHKFLQKKLKGTKGRIDKEKMQEIDAEWISDKESDYQKLFFKKLDEWGVDSLAELKKKNDIKKFFNELDTEWKAENEK